MLDRGDHAPSHVNCAEGAKQVSKPTRIGTKIVTGHFILRTTVSQIEVQTVAGLPQNVWCALHDSISTIQPVAQKRNIALRTNDPRAKPLGTPLQVLLVPDAHHSERKQKS